MLEREKYPPCAVAKSYGVVSARRTLNIGESVNPK